MLQSLTRFAFACLLVSSTGCAMNASEENDPAPVGQTQEALSLKSSPKGAMQLWARATWDAQLQTTMVDVSTTEVPPIDVVPSHDPHNGDTFLSVQAFTFRDGHRVNLATLSGVQIGPGGGCIHFSVPAGVGETVYVGGIVRLTTDLAPGAGVAAPAPVVVGDWVNDPTVLLDPTH